MHSTTPKNKWPRAAALDVARELCARLKPHCETLIVAGSLRRRKPLVGDVEILYISRIEQRPRDLFTTQPFPLADDEISRMLDDGTLTQRQSRIGGVAWGDLNKLAVHRGGIPVDLFRTTAESWHNYLVCRTGPAESNTRIAAAAQALGYRWNPYGPGYTHLATGTVTPMSSEAAVFEFVGLPYAAPWERDQTSPSVGANEKANAN